MKKAAKKKAPPKKKTAALSAKEQLAEGAKEIREAQTAAKADKQKPAPPPEPLVLKESTRPTDEILRQYVKVRPGSVGLEISPDIPIEENLRVLDWAQQMSDHVGFFIGDVINAGTSTYGEKYHQALNQTGRAYSTLAAYAETARRITHEHRQPSLSYSAHREMLRIGDTEKIVSTLKDVAKEAKDSKDGRVPTIKEIRNKVQKLTPKKPQKATSGKSAKNKKPAKVVPPYEPSADEAASIELAEEALQEVDDALDERTKTVIKKLDNATKRRFVKLLTPLANFCDALDKVTGY